MRPAFPLAALLAFCLLRPLPLAAQATVFALNVRDFGAVGDGKADDTRSIQAAMDAAVEGQRALYQVYFPPGNYRLTSSLKIERLANSLHLFGAGGTPLVSPSPTRLTWDGPQGGILLDSWAGFGVRLSDLCLDGKDKAGVLISVNSREGTPSDHWYVERVWLTHAATGMECGSQSDNCAADMTLVDLVMERVSVGFHTRSHQNVNYVFIRPVISFLDTGLWFEKGGSVTCNLLAGAFIGTAIRIDAGEVNTGNYYFNGIKVECYQVQGKRTTILNARGACTAVKITSLNTGTIGINPGDQPPYAPLFVLGPAAGVSVDSSIILGRKIAELTSAPAGTPTWLQFDNCYLTYTEPRWESAITRDANSGVELRNCRDSRGMIPHWRVEPACLSPEIVHGVKVTALGGGKVSVTWEPSLHATGYRVKRSPDGQTWADLGDTPAETTTFTDTKAPVGQEAWYQVQSLHDQVVQWPSIEPAHVTVR